MQKAARTATWTVGWALLAGGIVGGVVLVEPIAPINSVLWNTTSHINEDVVEMVGWDDLTAHVAQIHAAIPADEKSHTVILAGTYGEAGAFDLYGAAYGLPRVISGANSLWARGYGSPDPETVIVVGFNRYFADAHFSQCVAAGRVANRYRVKNEETTQHPGLYVCRKPLESWAKMWPTMQWFE